MEQNRPLLTAETIVRQSDDQVSCELDGDTVLMHLETGHYFGYDAIGSRIWALLEAPIRIQDLCRRLVDEFSGVDFEQCLADVRRFLEELRAEGLLLIHEEENV